MHGHQRQRNLAQRTVLLNFRDDVISQRGERGNLKKSTNTKFSISEGERTFSGSENETFQYLKMNNLDLEVDNRSWIKLNIGGVKYETTRDTLVKSKFFFKMLNGIIPVVVDSEMAYLIDRNGHLFAPILDFLRTGVLELPSGIKMSSIRREADFYLIELPEPNFENMVIEVLQKVWTDNRQSEIQVTSPVIETNFIKLMESLGLQSIDTQCWFFRNRSRDVQYLLLNILDELSKQSYIIRSSSTYFDEEVKCTITVVLLQKKIGLEFS